MSRSSLISLVASLAFAARIVWEARRHRMQERHTFFWLGLCAAVAGLAIWRQGIETFSAALGIYYAPSALFLCAVGALLYLVYRLSTQVAEQKWQLRHLVQEVAILSATTRGGSPPSGTPTNPST